MSFHVGQKVVCIKQGDWDAEFGETCPVFNGVYTIREIVTYFDGDALKLNEIVNAPLDYDEGLIECEFDAQEFRPLVETKSQISFTEGAPLDSHKFDNRKKQRERV